MNMRLISLVLPTAVAFFLLIGLSNAYPSQIQNGDFSSHLLRSSIFECPYYTHLDSCGVNCFTRHYTCDTSGSYLTEYDIPSYWNTIPFKVGNLGVLNTLRDVWLNTVDFHSSPSSAELLSYTGGLYPDNFCGYSNNGGSLGCSGIGNPGNYSLVPELWQNITFSSNQTIIDFWAKTIDPSVAFNEKATAINSSSDQEYYTCTFANSGLCQITTYLQLDILDSTGKAVYNQVFLLTQKWSEIKVDLSNLTSITLKNKDYVILFSAPSEHKNGVLIDDVSIIYDSPIKPFCADFCSSSTFFPAFQSNVQGASSITFQNQTAWNFITNINMLSSVVSSNKTVDVNNGPGVDFLDEWKLNTTNISSGSGDFYKFDIGIGISRAASFLKDFNIYYPVLYDIAGNKYNLTGTGLYSQPGIFWGHYNTSWCTHSMENHIFGYGPSNVTNITFNYTFVTAALCDIPGSQQIFNVNVSLDSATVTARKNWTFPYTVGDEVWKVSFPLFPYGFLFNGSNNNISFYWYNFGNTSSFPLPNLKITDTGSRYANLYHSGSLLFPTQKTDYGDYPFPNETIKDGTNIFNTAAGTLGDILRINGSDINPWYNGIIPVEISEFKTANITDGICTYQSIPEASTCGFVSVANQTQQIQDISLAFGTYAGIFKAVISPAFVWLIISIMATFWLPSKIASHETNKGSYYLVLLIVFGFVGATFGILDTVTGIILIGFASVVFVNEIRKGFGGG